MKIGHEVGGVFYDENKCESPIERDVAWTLCKRMKRGASLEQQVWIVGSDGKNYRADFVLRRDGRAVILECDGKHHHDLERDEARDRATLLPGEFQAVYRFRGQDIYYRLDDLLYLLCKYEPEFFDEHSAQIIQTLAAPETKEQAEYWDGAGAVIYYPIPDSDGRNFELVMFRRTADMFTTKEAA